MTRATTWDGETPTGVALLRQKVEQIKEDEESTRKRITDHEKECSVRHQALAEQMQGMRTDLHTLKVQKAVILALILVVGGGIAGATRWLMRSAVRDVLVEHGVVEFRRPGQ